MKKMTLILIFFSLIFAAELQYDEYNRHLLNKKIKIMSVNVNDIRNIYIFIQIVYN